MLTDLKCFLLIRIKSFVLADEINFNINTLIITFSERKPPLPLSLHYDSSPSVKYFLTELHSSSIVNSTCITLEWALNPSAIVF